MPMFPSAVVAPAFTATLVEYTASSFLMTVIA
jgi:hypothetical protein